MKQLSGIVPPIPTPFGQNEALALHLQQRLIGKLAPSSDGFLILGSNGEAVYLSEVERREVLASAREVISRDKVMIAGTGGEATRTVIARCEEAAEIGADYALVVPPFYFKSQMTEAVLDAHYRKVADASPIPVLLYNVPAATTLALSATLIAELADHPNIAGIKDSSGNIAAMTDYLGRVPTRFTVLTGSAPTFLAALSVGATGGILAVANLIPEVYRQILSHLNAGRVADARALQLAHNPLAAAVSSQYGVAGLKAALALQGNDMGDVRSPLQNVSDTVRKELEQLLSQIQVKVQRQTV
jgi:4-hydroxy-2-oxoglutarate aldolase